MPQKPGPARTRTPQEVADVIKHLCTQGRGGVSPKVTFLVGAGFSVSAGVPLAGMIVERHLRGHPLLARVPPCPPNRSEYAHLMDHMDPASERTGIIRRAINEARDGATGRMRINWAHLLLATLVDAGYVRSILTTNFDPLLIDALAMTGQPVRAFDLTASEYFHAGVLEPASIVYLHGQAHSIMLCNAASEMENVRRWIGKALQEALADAVLVVVGYSGECDPVFQELSENYRQFPHGLYWAHYHPKGAPPSDAVLSLVQDPRRGAHLITGLDADEFMRSLVVEGLGLSVPALVLDPLAHALSTLGRVTAYPQPADQPPVPTPIGSAIDDLRRAREWLRNEGERPGTGEGAASVSPEMSIAIGAMTGDRQRLDSVRASVDAGKSDLHMQLGTAYQSVASRMLENGQHEEAMAVLKDVERLGTDSPHWLQTLWGIALADRARGLSEPEGPELFRQAGERFAEALRLAPEMYQAYNNWGLALADHARLATGRRSSELFGQAGEKFERAVSIKPDMHEALYNWGNALADEAVQAPLPRAVELFERAGAKFAEALRIKPSKHEALNNWGTVLTKQATQTGLDGAAATSLLHQAGKKFAEALRVKPDKHDALHNWGIALLRQAELAEGDACIELLRQAAAKFADAVRLKPDMCKAINNWGVVLMELAKRVPREESRAIFEQSEEKFVQLIAMRPAHESARYNAACLAALQGRVAETVAALRAWVTVDPRACSRIVDSDSDFDLVRGDPLFRECLKELPVQIPG